MWIEAQNFVLTSRLEWDTPLGVLLLIGLLMVTTAGVLVESGAVALLLGRLARSTARGHAVRAAPAPQRG